MFYGQNLVETFIINEFIAAAPPFLGRNTPDFVCAVYDDRGINKLKERDDALYALVHMFNFLRLMNFHVLTWIEKKTLKKAVSGCQ